MKNRFPFFVLVCLFFVTFSGVSAYSEEQPSESPSRPLLEQTHFKDFTFRGSWKVDEESMYPSGAKEGERLSIEQIDSRIYYVYSGMLPKKYTRLGFGGALNFKYYTGLSYDYLRKNLPGKTVYIDALMPGEAISPNNTIPNRVQVTVKSETDGEWVNYHGSREWTTVKKPGRYTFRLKIPKSPQMMKYGKMFVPENTILFTLEFYLMEGAKHNSFVSYPFFNFRIEGIDLDPHALKWQAVKDGYALQGVYLPSFVKGSTLISSMGKDLELKFDELSKEGMEEHGFSGNLKDMFITLVAFIPEELRYQKGTIALTIRDDGGTVRSSVKNFDSCNLEGKVFLTLPLDAFSMEKGIEALAKNTTITLKIKTAKPHTIDMMPIILEPIMARKGRLVSFDKSWQVRDIQGLGGYKALEVRKDALVGGGGITVLDLKKELYQLDTVIRLKGGIDWENPLYRVELMKSFDEGPVNLDNMRIEVLINPLTDTTDVWQKPYRARIGLLDTNGNVMFGPNVSLSEGLSSLAYLDVSLTNPIPKGFVMPGFDPENVTAMLINVEASHAHLDPKDLNVSFVDMNISPKEYMRTSPFKIIDFSRFERDPQKWEITSIVKKAGGYAVGINLPFPVVDVPEIVLRVPQIYPCVGMKPTDARHFGLSSKITRDATVKAFKRFVEQDIDMVRLLVLGHLDGIFMWDERGKDIAGFGEGADEMVQEMAGMSIEKFTEFLNKNEKKVFQVDEEDGVPLGIEKHVIPDFMALLDILEKVERDTGRRLVAIVSLYDFMLGDGVTEEGPRRIFTVGEHPEVVTDPQVKIKAHALLWKLMKILSKDERFYRYIAVMEIMNEPANASVLATKENFVDLVNFVGEGLYILKDALGPSIPVSVGFRSWAADLRYWSTIAGGIDILMPHYWESLESYNIDTPGLWPLDMPVEELWKYLGTDQEGRLTGMAEMSPGTSGEVLKKNLDRLERAGYDFTLVWSYSGHDGHDAKPVMNEIGQYQRANLEFGELKREERPYLKKAFLYIITARTFFDAKQKLAWTKTEGTDAEFREYLVLRTGNIANKDLKRTIDKILEVFELKGMPLSFRNIKFVMLRAMEEQA